MVRKKRGSPWPLRLAALALLITAGAGAWLWWDIQHWTPPVSAYPDQGVLVSADNADLNFSTLKALGARFAYIRSSHGAQGQERAFTRSFGAADKAGLQHGAVHSYDPCVPADGQSANFVRVVPRDSSLLPPVIELAKLGDDCRKRVTDASVESELMTLVNQIEIHAGSPVILKISPQFEKRYKLASRIERNIWLSRTRFEPDYAGRPWLLWSANAALRSGADEEPVEWVVMRP